MNQQQPVSPLSDVRWLLLLCGSRMGFCLINTAYSALIPSLRESWAMSASQAGLVQSAWHGGYVFSLVVASELAGRFGAKKTFLGMSFMAAGSALLFAWGAHDFASAFLLYGLAGLCAGGSYVPGLTLLAERFPSATRGRAMGAYIAAASLGYALGLLGASLLAAWWNPAAGFFLAASGSLLGVTLGFTALKNTPNRVPEGAQGGASAGASWVSLRRLWHNRPARFVIMGYTFHAWELLGMWAWLPAFLAFACGQGGVAAGTSALVMAGASLAALTHLLSMAGSLGGGVLSDRWGRRRVILLMSWSSIACSLLIGWTLALPPMVLLPLLVVVAIVFNLTAIADSAIYSAALTEVVPSADLATAYALRSVLGFGMGALSPWLFGRVLDGLSGTGTAAAPLAWTWAWTGLGLVAVLGPWAMHRLPPKAASRAG